MIERTFSASLSFCFYLLTDNFLSFNCVFSRIWQFLAGMCISHNDYMEIGMAVFNLQTTLDKIEPKTDGESQENFLDEEEVDGLLKTN